MLDAAPRPTRAPPLSRGRRSRSRQPWRADSLPRHFRRRPVAQVVHADSNRCIVAPRLRAAALLQPKPLNVTTTGRSSPCRMVAPLPLTPALSLHSTALLDFQDNWQTRWSHRQAYIYYSKIMEKRVRKTRDSAKEREREREEKQERAQESARESKRERKKARERTRERARERERVQGQGLGFNECR